MFSLASELSNVSRALLMSQYVCEESQLNCTIRSFPVAIAAIFTTCLFSSLSTPFWSLEGEIRGRKYALIVATLGTAFVNILFAVISTGSRFEGPAPILIIGGLALEGLLGGTATFRAALNAYAADVAPAGTWSTSFSVLQGVFVVCSVLGSSIGFGLNLFGPFLGFAVGAGVAAINLVYLVFFLPESLPEEFELDRPSKLQLSDFKSSISSMFAALSGDRMSLLVLAFFVYSLTLSANFIRHPFALSQTDTASSIPFVVTSYLSEMLAFFALFPGIVYILKRRTPLSMAISTKHYLASVTTIDVSASRLFAFTDLANQLLVLLISASPSLAFFFVALMVPLTSGLKPAFQALIAAFSESRTTRSRRGVLFGALSVVELIGQTFSHVIYRLTSRHGVSPKAGFGVTASLLGIVAIILSLWPTSPRSGPGDLPRDHERIRIVVSEAPAEQNADATLSPVYRRHGVVEGSTETL
ncbi:hypothetical protein HMN09_00413600 [Mycena chlorophos]|uniref:Major facilitator superfamily (MFS) profile domain-containing protein n=1 Tax=Mycena chlorophos TaxID=658473 RepID=A0A8H6TDG8_MYCCL|nr:hypothetical protein HMN09_00413600 [Mycena chlorophos]